MFDSATELFAYIEEAGIEIIDLRITDIYGAWRHLTLPVSAFTPDVVDRGFGFDGSSVGFTRLESGDLVLRPDLSSAFPDPFHDGPALGIVADVVHSDTYEPFPHCPRQVARRAEEVLRSSGVADSSRWGPEFEFYVFQSVSVENSQTRTAAEVQPLEMPWQKLPPRRSSGYFASPPRDLSALLRERICARLVDAGVPVKYHHREVGGLGQCEIELPLGGLLKMADRCQIVKYVSKMCAFEEGLTVTFMPKPLFSEAGSGMHFHQHLFLKGEPLFFDESGYAGLSDAAEQYAAGILSHGRALTGLTNPSSNSFKRLVPGFEAPVNLFFSLANRSAAIRVPKYANQPDTKRIEYRPPDATSNPYLAMAAQLLAGLDGMERKLDPRGLGLGPFDEDIFQWPADRRRLIAPLPRTLEEALEALRTDSEFLSRGGVFTPEMIDTFIHNKWENECTEINKRPHPFEYELYYDC